MFLSTDAYMEKILGLVITYSRKKIRQSNKQVCMVIARLYN